MFPVKIFSTPAILIFYMFLFNKKNKLPPLNKLKIKPSNKITVSKNSPIKNKNNKNSSVKSNNNSPAISTTTTNITKTISKKINRKRGVTIIFFFQRTIIMYTLIYTFHNNVANRVTKCF